ncbi:tungstate ABC transporter substrate-binding protein WtpA [Hippea jasoniae]|uniref:tungstate ABC transporter substrate-binding protein WtpA n=1 Tax=Hippea jasoniae TaxID=944479 RepID=UPI000689378E|nr:tungstate ABC transporter substrate-binding protein WtpA [Hippea jasoniae]
MAVLKSFILSVATFVFLFCTTAFAASNIIIFHAGSLTVPIRKMAKAFQKKYPQYRILDEPSGSRVAARKVAELKKPCDIVASADYTVINNILMKKGFADFNIEFATNSLAIVYTKKSRYAGIINQKNWPYILLKKDVVVGHSNPNDDPCGYRAMFVAKLAQKYYHIKDFYKKLFGYPDYYKPGFEKKGKIVVRPKETDLLSLLEAGDVDYIFLYKSVAIQHHLKYIQLPDHINLSNPEYAKFYSQACFKVTANSPNNYILKCAKPIIYSLTIPHNENSPQNPDGAILFVKFMLSKKGQSILKSCGQGIINPPVVIGKKPVWLK